MIVTDSDGNVVEELTDRGDGTGTWTHYADGEVIATHEVTDLPVVPPDPPVQVLVPIEGGGVASLDITADGTPRFTPL